ncbi:MAG: phytanoyl-CoA dioxygenase family protein [Pseudomonadota bacterium]
MKIPHHRAGDPLDDIAATLANAGCCVLHDMHSTKASADVVEQLKAHMACAKVSKDDDGTEFYPGHTRRISSLLARSEGVREMALNDLVKRLCERHFGNNCERHHLHVSAALEIGPGARKQILHREEDPFDFFPLPRPNLVLATMWAMSDFTAANGATLLIPGSHTWDAQRPPTQDEVVAAEMPRGSVLVWLGGTLHAAGANVSDSWRYGIILSYSLGWLRQEENQYLALPQHLAAEMPNEVLDLIGYPMHGSLGFYDPRVATQA